MVQGIGGVPLQLALGVDSLGLTMMLLTTLVVLVCLLSATLTVTDNYVAYAGWVLLAEAGLLTVFLSMDLLLFYIGFELALLPLLVLIARWGALDAGPAAKRFVLFTLAGSIPMVLALIGIMQKYAGVLGPTVLFEDLSQHAWQMMATETAGDQFWIFALLTLGLGIKMAILPLHTWLPSTYVAAHPTTTALLAAVVLKLGLFGFLRLVLPLVPAACFAYGPLFLGTMGTVAIIYGALAALAQTDLRRLLAYASLSHVGFISIGLFSLTPEGIAGASLQMFNHGITTAAMFLLVGSIMARRGTASIPNGSKGLAKPYPVLAALMVFFTMAGAGLPGLNNFVGELMALMSMMHRHPWISIFATSGVILGAWYSLRLVRDLLFGEYDRSVNQSPRNRTQHGEDSHHEVLKGDLVVREWLPLLGLGVLCLVIGCMPSMPLGCLKHDVDLLGRLYRDVEMQSLKAVAETTPPTAQLVPTVSPRLLVQNDQ